MNETFEVRIGKHTHTFSSRDEMNCVLRSCRLTKWRALRLWMRTTLDPNYVHPRKIRRPE
jgi:hypothetical protein